MVFQGKVKIYWFSKETVNISQIIVLILIVKWI